MIKGKVLKDRQALKSILTTASPEKLKLILDMVSKFRKDIPIDARPDFPSTDHSTSSIEFNDNVNSIPDGNDLVLPIFRWWEIFRFTDIPNQPELNQINRKIDRKDRFRIIDDIMHLTFTNELKGCLPLEYMNKPWIDLMKIGPKASRLKGPTFKLYKKQFNG